MHSEVGRIYAEINAVGARVFADPKVIGEKVLGIGPRRNCEVNEVIIIGETAFEAREKVMPAHMVQHLLTGAIEKHRPGKEGVKRVAVDLQGRKVGAVKRPGLGKKLGAIAEIEIRTGGLISVVKRSIRCDVEPVIRGIAVLDKVVPTHEH